MLLSDKFYYVKVLQELNIRSKYIFFVLYYILDNQIHKSAIVYFFNKLSKLHDLRALSLGCIYKYNFICLYKFYRNSYWNR